MGRRRRSDPKREARGRERLASYRDFIDDWEAFEAAIRIPEPTTLRANTLRISREALADRLEAQGYAVSPVAHQPAFLRVDEEPEGRPVSDTLEHWMGLFYMQQTATGLAAPLLGPEAGERVLDLCSAPGGKTTHLAELMEGRGTVVASDVNETRIRALLGNLYRLGHTNVMTVAGDGRRFPEGATFDRVMVDVPCSAEGTLRKRGGKIPGHSGKWAKQVTKAQEKLLRKAVVLTRPGGTLLYVTCTFGPDENEAVLTRVLADAPISVDPIELPVPHARGLEAFGDARFDPSLVGAVRIYPHHLDSGGLFMCRLRREAGEGGDGEAGEHGHATRVRGWTPVPADFPFSDEPGEGSADADAPPVEEVVARGRAFMDQEVGLPEGRLDALSWLRRGTNLWAHTLEGWPAEAWKEGGHWRVVQVGFRAWDLGGNGPPRPTNDLLGWLGDAVPRRVDLSAGRWVRLLEGRTLPDEGDDGLVALGFRGTALARGFRRDGVLRHEVPKGRLRWLRAAMEGWAEDEDAG
ncbi:MAG TPA: RsmB/NOP family class I SAM-dependent RNA methyltransferase [Longimicrobiales bacterium]|nr:RsmB/NOP family class I SAM-dependent RNA methyltransferase [Longimicrobiales bacterium]